MDFHSPRPLLILFYKKMEFSVQEKFIRSMSFNTKDFFFSKNSCIVVLRDSLGFLKEICFTKFSSSVSKTLFPLFQQISWITPSRACYVPNVYSAGIQPCICRG